MFNEVKTLLSSIDNAQGGEAVQQAAGDHVQDMPTGQVQQHIQTAADNAARTGDASAADTLKSLLAASQSEGLKQALIQELTKNPQLLQHFAPEFAKAILTRVL